MGYTESGESDRMRRMEKMSDGWEKRDAMKKRREIGQIEWDTWERDGKIDDGEIKIYLERGRERGVGGDF